MLISFPYKFRWREHQKAAWNAFIKNNIKHILLIWHRRAGKTKLAVNILAAAAHQRIGLYYFIFPTRKQARDTVWFGRGKDGIKFVDHFPPHLIEKTNDADLSITFKNGSIVQLRGSSMGSYESLRGGNPIGFLYDEYALIDPNARRAMDIAIEENEGWEIIISTPRSHNHLYELYNKVANDPDWFVQLLTIDDTADEFGKPIFSSKMIARLEKEHSKDWVDQELHCSF